MHDAWLFSLVCLHLVILCSVKYLKLLMWVCRLFSSSKHSDCRWTYLIINGWCFVLARASRSTNSKNRSAPRKSSTSAATTSCIQDSQTPYSTSTRRSTCMDVQKSLWCQIQVGPQTYSLFRLTIDLTAVNLFIHVYI